MGVGWSMEAGVEAEEDPRSPTSTLTRTPLQPQHNNCDVQVGHKKPVRVLDFDPRSPSAMSRTPIVVHATPPTRRSQSSLDTPVAARVKDMKVDGMSKSVLSRVLDCDPRSPSTGIDRTPILLDKHKPADTTEVPADTLEFNTATSVGVDEFCSQLQELCVSEGVTQEETVTEDHELFLSCEEQAVEEEVVYVNKQLSRLQDNTEYRKSPLPLTRTPVYEDPNLTRTPVYTDTDTPTAKSNSTPSHKSKKTMRRRPLAVLNTQHSVDSPKRSVKLATLATNSPHMSMSPHLAMSPVVFDDKENVPL